MGTPRQYLSIEDLCAQLGIAPSAFYQWRAHQYLSIKGLCAELDIAPSTFYEWRAKGNAPVCIKLPNGEIRIRRTDFEAWLTSREVTEVAA